MDKKFVSESVDRDTQVHDAVEGVSKRSSPNYRFKKSSQVNADGRGEKEANRSPAVEALEKPYSIYTAGEKWFIVTIAAFAALFR